MFPQKFPSAEFVESKTYPLGENNEHLRNGRALALVALSHTPVEQRLYSVMLSAPAESSSFTVRRLAALSGINSLSTIRRGLEGLIMKLSIERSSKTNGNGKRQQPCSYQVFKPEEIILRRRERGQTGLTTTSGNGESRNGTQSFDRALERVAENVMLSRREAQVALCCVEGLTNAEIGKRLRVSEQTVKFHLRHIFIKFGVKRRAELISRLLM